MKKFDYDECIKNHDKYAATAKGLKARLLCNNVKGEFPIVAVLEIGEIESICAFSSDGIIRGVVPLLFSGKEKEEDYTLFTPSKRIKRTGRIHVYDRSLSPIFPTLESAKRNLCGNEMAACVEVTIDCFEGEGLD